MALALFAYGSLVSSRSAAETLGRPVTLSPARLVGWRRSFSLARDNRTCEKTFARAGDGYIPDLVLALNARAEPGADPEAAVNGALITITPEELDRLDVRELRYDRVDVTDAVVTDTPSTPIERAVTYVAKRENRLHGPLPESAVILASYERAVEEAFAALGAGQLEAYRDSTDACPAERIEPVLVAESIPAGNPREW